MKKASISILKAQLSQYLDAVKSGEEVIVTERGRPVARLVPLALEHTPGGRTAQLVREGRMRSPSVYSGAEILPPPTGIDAEGHSLRTLLDDRADGR